MKTSADYKKGEVLPKLESASLRMPILEGLPEAKVLIIERFVSSGVY